MSTPCIMYRVGRKPYLTTRFVETPENCQLTVPFIIGSGHQMGGHHLFLQTLREGGTVEVEFGCDRGFEAVATLDAARVSRYKKRSSSEVPEAGRMARFYDLRVQVGDLFQYVTRLK